MKNLKLKSNSKGITLVALVITIIVLIILAGVSISMLLGDNGIISSAKRAADLTEQATIKEQLEMYKLLSQLENKDFIDLLVDNNMIDEEELENNGITKIGDDEKNLAINSVKGLEIISNLVESGDDYSGCNIYLLNDIIFDTKFDSKTGELISGKAFTPIGDSNSKIEDELEEESKKTVFNGTFDGLNHEIKNLYIKETENTSYCTGLFGYIGENGVVKNLVISNSYISGNYETGAIAGRSRGTISNCINNCKITGGTLTGGIAGRNCGTIENCTNYGDIDASNIQAGGIVANCDFGENIIVRNCKNYGNITSTSNTIGGIVGGAYANINTPTISNCMNYGNIGDTTSNYTYIGGIAGTSRGNIEECTNNGEIKGYSNVGGIVGWIAQQNNNETLITKCQNNNKVTGTYCRVGGICGTNQGGTISYSSNNSEVSLLGEIAYFGVAGIVGSNGSTTNNTKIEYCYNSGTINFHPTTSTNADPQCAGIVGNSTANTNGSTKTEIISCYNIGEINCSGPYSSYTQAGIIGWANYVEISNCYNSGELIHESGHTAHGIVGSYNTNSSCIFTNNYWLDSCGASYGIGKSFTNDNAQPKNESDIKDLSKTPLGEDYDQDDKINDGYPYLKWQTKK